MARTFLAEPAVGLGREERGLLLELARAAVRKGLCGEQPAVEPRAYAPALQARRASFVTLTVTEELRGCIGTLEACEPLVVDVVRNAYAAAFRDPRFPALTWPEFEFLAIKISILSAAEPIVFASEAQLLAQLRPGIDGLILEERGYRGTFLPAVWETLCEPREFLRSLKRKAGLPADYWSDTLKVSRYTTESIP